jgi:hypothetical protein
MTAAAPLNSTVRCRLSNSAQEAVVSVLRIFESDKPSQIGWAVTRHVATKYPPADFMPFVPVAVAETMRAYALEFVEVGPRTPEDLVLIESSVYSAKFFEGLETEEQKKAKLAEERKNAQVAVFNAIHALAKYFSGRVAARATPNTSLERTRER